MKFKSKAGKMIMTGKGQIIKFKGEFFETDDKDIIKCMKGANGVSEVKADKSK